LGKLERGPHPLRSEGVHREGHQIAQHLGGCQTGGKDNKKKHYAGQTSLNNKEKPSTKNVCLSKRYPGGQGKKGGGPGDNFFRDNQMANGNLALVTKRPTKKTGRGEGRGPGGGNRNFSRPPQLGDQIRTTKKKREGVRGAERGQGGGETRGNF